MLKEIVSKLLKEPSSFCPYGTIKDRAKWNELPAQVKEQLLKNAEQYLGFQYPSIPATVYMEFTKTGNRENYQTLIFQRRCVLNALVLGECIQNKGYFLEDIINGIYAICEESGWQLPAHNAYERDKTQLVLPDITRPIIDLFAAETGCILAVTDYLLKEVLDTISPLISIAINDNLQRRIITPYLTEQFWWMGNGKNPMNNWTVWCTQNVLITAFTRSLKAELKFQIMEKACQSIDYFLEGYGEDGCCDEGAEYYHHAGLCLFNALEVLNSVSDNKFAVLYENSKIKNIASFLLNVHIDDKYYVNFADCSPIAGRCTAREYLFGKRTGLKELMKFAADDYKLNIDFIKQQEHNLFYRLQLAFTHEEIINYKTLTPICYKDIYYESAGLFLARDQRFCLAVKAGNNGDSHNHNDTGSFTIYSYGKPMFIDIGVETYTRKTFSPQRYEIWTMQSAYHNLPTFDGVMQSDGANYGAADVSYSFHEEEAFITMDIAKAYPYCGVKTYRRTALLKKGTGIIITDTFETTAKRTILSLITYEKPDIHNNRITVGKLGNMELIGDSEITVEVIPITDARLKTAWEHEIYRILIELKSKQINLIIT